MIGIILLLICMLLIWMVLIWSIKKRLNRCVRYLEWDAEISKLNTGFRTTFGYQPTQEKPRYSDNITTVQNNGNVAQNK